MDGIRFQEDVAKENSLASLEGSIQNEVYKIWLDMKKIILKVIKKVKNFNHIYDEEDYLNESYFAVLEAYIKYDRFHKYKECDCETYEILSQKPTMKFQTYAYWYIQKKIYHMAKTGDIEFVDEDGEIMQAKDFYRNKKNIKNKKIFSRKKVFTFSELSFYSNGNGNKYDKENYYEAVDYETLQKIKRGKYL